MPYGDTSYSIQVAVMSSVFAVVDEILIQHVLFLDGSVVVMRYIFKDIIVLLHLRAVDWVA